MASSLLAVGLAATCWCPSRPKAAWLPVPFPWAHYSGSLLLFVLATALLRNDLHIINLPILNVKFQVFSTCRVVRP